MTAALHLASFGTTVDAARWSGRLHIEARPGLGRADQPGVRTATVR
jgi:hypothetical protein